MCLGLPGRVVSIPDIGGIGRVEVAGVIRDVDLSLLPGPWKPNERVLVHSGFALERLSTERADEAEKLFGR